MRPILFLHHVRFQLAAACGVGLLLGVASLWFAPLWTLGAVVGGGLAFSTLKWPEIGLLGILVATSSIVFENRLPLVPIGVGSLHVPDLILLALFGLIALRWLVEPDFRIIRTPLDWPMLAFYGVMVLMTLLAILRSSLGNEEGRRAIRIVTYYSTFFLVTNLVREKRQLRLLLGGLFLLATLIAVAMAAQFIAGESAAFLPGRVEALWTQGESYTGIARLLPPGQSTILVAFTAITSIWVIDRPKPYSVLGLFQWGLLGSAVLLTFTRTFWVQVGLALLVLAFVVGERGRRRLIGFGLVVLLLAVIILLPALDRPDSRLGRMASASFERLATLGKADTLAESSLRWRYVENEYALRQIAASPLLGLGLGAQYRPFDPRLDDPWSDWDARGYIHNGHLWILMMGGLLGYLALMWLSIAFLIRGFRYWRLIPTSRMRGCVLGFTLTYLGVLVGAITNPMFLQWYWTPLLGMMMGINEVVFRETLPR